MVKRLTMLLASLFLVLGVALAQTQVSGYVTSSEDGEPVIGASIKVVGTSTGTVTDVDGKFSLSVSSNAQLQVSYIGMITKTVKAAENMKIVLDPDNKTLDEVMVVAYGTSKKSSFTGSAQNVDSKKLELRPVTTVTKALDGNVSGVQMTTGSGQPGSDPSIHIRGFGSINASSSPLIVVDGIPYDGSLANINPSDIEQMTILKDASAGALYGARGANGVVMISTKKGKDGKAQVTWRSTVGWSNRATKRYEQVDQKEYVQLVYEALRNEAYGQGKTWEEAEAYGRENLKNTLGGESYNPFKNYTWDTIINKTTGQVQEDAVSAWNENWMDAVENKNAFRHEHQLSINGGSDRTKYMLSLGYLNEDGTLKTTNFQRYTGRVNVDSKITDWFSANMGLNVGYSVSNFSNYTGSSNSNVWYTAQFVNPLYPVYLKDANGNTIYKNGEAELDWGEVKTNGDVRPGSLSDFSSLGMLLLDKTEALRDVAGMRSGLVFGGDKDNFGWLKGVKLALNFGFDYNNRNNSDRMNSEHGNQASAGGLLTKYESRTQSYTLNQLLTWTRDFGKHNFDFLVGHEYYAYTYKYLMARRSGLMDGIDELSPASTLKGGTSYSYDYRIDSYLSRFNYTYDDKYYLSASLRRDSSSRFKKNHRTGTFWSIGGNWRVSQEKFLKDVRWIDNLSMKMSYGEQGNDNILDSDGNSRYYLWQGLSSTSYSNANAVGTLVSTLENSNVTWEKNGNFNVGVEGSFLDNRIKASVEYYYRKTTDMLLSYPMAVSTGFTGYDANVGNMRNTGVELEISGTPVRTKDFSWTLTWMGSTISNKVTKLTEQTDQILSGSYITKVGLPYNSFYMSKSAGVDPETGKQLFWAYEKDANGNITKEYVTDNMSVASSCRYEMGSRIPDIYGSIGTTLTYKNFDLSILTSYSIGGKILDGVYYGDMNLAYISNGLHKDVLRRWQKPGDVTDVPRMLIHESTLVLDRYLFDASYFSIKNITLTYTLPKSVTNSIGLNGVRVFCSADNLALWSHLDGMDPQYNFSGGTGYGYAGNKTWTLGLEVNF